MKTVHIIIFILLAVTVYLLYKNSILFYSPPPENIVVVRGETEKVLEGGDEVPATWNIDWDGGPGRDRYRIMNEKGPWNPDGVI